MIDFFFKIRSIISIFLITILVNSANAQSTNRYEIALKGCLQKHGVQPYNTGCMNGVMAPDFFGKTLNGNLIQLRKLRGKVIVLYFWFIACGPCRMEIPSLNKIALKFKNEDIVFVSIANDKESNLKKYLGSNQFVFQTIADPASIIFEKKYHIRNFPTTIVIDKKGAIKLFTQGSKDSEADIDNLLDENLVRSIDECLGKKYVKNKSFAYPPNLIKF
jgi:peroxiredoxin